MPIANITISARERLVLSAFLVQSAKAKGPVEERALLTAFDEFGLTPLLAKLDTQALWTTSEALEDVPVSTASIAMVIEALNGPEPKAPLQAIILRPLADRLSKVAAN